MAATFNPKEYNRLLDDVCTLYDQIRLHSTDKNKHALKTYWQIGRRILNTVNAASQGSSYGKKIIQTLSSDLTQKYGDGFGVRTVDYFRSFANKYFHHRIHALQGRRRHGTQYADGQMPNAR